MQRSKAAENCQESLAIGKLWTACWCWCRAFLWQSQLHVRRVKGAQNSFFWRHAQIELKDVPPLPLLVVLFGIPAGCIIGTLKVLVDRLKEIGKGEEDAYRNY